MADSRKDDNDYSKEGLISKLKNALIKYDPDSFLHLLAEHALEDLTKLEGPVTEVILVNALNALDFEPSKIAEAKEKLKKTNQHNVENLAPQNNQNLDNNLNVNKQQNNSNGNDNNADFDNLNNNHIDQNLNAQIKEENQEPNLGQQTLENKRKELVEKRKKLQEEREKEKKDNPTDGKDGPYDDEPPPSYQDISTGDAFLKELSDLYDRAAAVKLNLAENTTTNNFDSLSNLNDELKNLIDDAKDAIDYFNKYRSTLDPDELKNGPLTEMKKKLSKLENQVTVVKLEKLKTNVDTLKNQKDILQATLATSKLQDNDKLKPLRKQLETLSQTIAETYNKIDTLKDNVEKDNISFVDNGTASGTFNVEFKNLEYAVKQHIHKYEEIYTAFTNIQSQLKVNDLEKWKRYYSKDDPGAPSDPKDPGYLTSDEKNKVKEPQKILNTLKFMEANLDRIRNIRNNSELQKWRDKCIYLYGILDAYKTHLENQNKLNDKDNVNLEIVNKCLDKLIENDSVTKKKGLLIDEEKLGPNFSVTGEVSFIGTGVDKLNDDKPATILASLQTMDSTFKQPSDSPDTDDDNNLALESSPSLQQKNIETSANYVLTYHNISYNNKTAKYWTVHSNEGGTYSAKFYAKPTHLEFGGERTYVEAIPPRASIPNDRILAWAMTQVANFCRNNPYGKNMIKLKGELGEGFTKEHVEAIMLYAQYANIQIRNETDVPVPKFKKSQIEGLHNKLSSIASTIGPNPLKDLVTNTIKPLKDEDKADKKTFEKKSQVPEENTRRFKL